MFNTVVHNVRWSAGKPGHSVMVKKRKSSDRRDARLGVRLHSDLREALERLADEDGRSISQYVERVLAEHVRQKAVTGRHKPGT